MSACQICNTPQKDDLFAAVTGEPVCSICKLTYVGGLPSTPDRITAVRQMLGLKDGEFIKHDRGEEARRILDRRHLMTDVERFYQHLSDCESCHYDDDHERFTLCEEGRELLYEAADDLPEAWQKELERILRNEELQREADENFRFYAGMEEF